MKKRPFNVSLGKSVLESRIVVYYSFIHIFYNIAFIRFFNKRFIFQKLPFPPSHFHSKMISNPMSQNPAHCKTKEQIINNKKQKISSKIFLSVVITLAVITLLAACATKPAAVEGLVSLDEAMAAITAMVGL